MALVVLRCRLHDAELVSSDPSKVFGWLGEHASSCMRQVSCITFEEEPMRPIPPGVEQPELSFEGVSW